jgi:hypothetical protein
MDRLNTSEHRHKTGHERAEHDRIVSVRHGHGRTWHGRTWHGRTGHDQIVSERHEYPLIIMMRPQSGPNLAQVSKIIEEDVHLSFYANLKVTTCWDPTQQPNIP